MKVNYNGLVLTVRKKFYKNGRIALFLTDEDNFPYMTATVNLPNQELDEEDLTFIKNWAENEGILEALIEAKVVEDMETQTQTGFVWADLVRVLI